MRNSRRASPLSHLYSVPLSRQRRQSFNIPCKGAINVSPTPKLTAWRKRMITARAVALPAYRNGREDRKDHLLVIAGKDPLGSV